MDQFVEFVENHWILSSVWTFLFALLISSYMKGAFSGIKKLTSQQAVQLMNREKALVVDLRTPNEYQQGHIIDALNIPFLSLNDTVSVKKLEAYKEKPLIMVCATGMQSGVGAAQLKKHGFTQLYKIEGGVQAWIKDKLPLSTPETTKGTNKNAKKKQKSKDNNPAKKES